LLHELIPIIAPVFICALIGFCWARSGLPFDNNTISQLVMNIGAPSLIIHSLTSTQLSLHTFLQIAQYTLYISLLMALLSVLALRFWGLNIRCYLPSALFSNVGNIGLPVCYFAFGDIGLAYGLAFFMMMSIGHFSFGISWISGESFTSTLLKNPVIHSIWVGVLLLYTEWSLPLWFNNTLELISGFAIPLMLIALGVSLSYLKVGHMILAVRMSVLRIVGGFTIAYGLTEAMGITGEMRGVLLIQSAMPVAVFNYLLAQRYNRNPTEIAGIVVISTLMGFCFMPLILWFALN